MDSGRPSGERTRVVVLLLLGSLRRRVRPEGALPLPPVRSLAFFLPVIAEVLDQPLPTGYVDYLRHKIQAVRSA